MNSDPWSYVIYIGRGYVVNHVVSTKLSIDITLLSSCCIILNHPVIGSILVTAFSFKFYVCTFLLMTCGAIISTQSFLCGVSSDYLADNLPYLIFDRFLHWQVLQLVTSFWMASLMPGRYTFW